MSMKYSAIAKQQSVLMVAPAVAILLVLGIFPFFYFLYSMTQQWVLVSGIPPRFIGLQHFAALFQDARFWMALYRSVIFTVSVVSIEFVMGMVVALILLNHPVNLFRSFVLLPMMAAPTAVGLIWRFMYNDEIGIVNFMLKQIGIAGPLWLGNQHIAMFSIVLVDVWQWTPFMILILLSGLSGVPVDVQEASLIDGANAWQRFIFVTVPLIRKPIFVALIFRIIDSFRAFDTIYVVTAGGPNGATELLNFYTYLTSFRFFDIGYGSALALITLIILTIAGRFLINIIKEQ